MENGRDGGVEKRRYSSNLFSFFHFLLFPCLFLFFFFCFDFCNILPNFRRVYNKNKDMEEVVSLRFEESLPKCEV